MSDPANLRLAGVRQEIYAEAARYAREHSTDPEGNLPPEPALPGSIDGARSEWIPTFLGPESLRQVEAFSRRVQELLRERGVDRSDWREIFGMNPYFDPRLGDFSLRDNPEAAHRVVEQEQRQLDINDRDRILARGGDWRAEVNRLVDAASQVSPAAGQRLRGQLEASTHAAEAQERELGAAAQALDPSMAGRSLEAVVAHLRTPAGRALRTAARTRLLESSQGRLQALWTQADEAARAAAARRGGSPAGATGGEGAPGGRRQPRAAGAGPERHPSDIPAALRERILMETIRAKSLEDEAYLPSAIQSVPFDQQANFERPVGRGEVPSALRPMGAMERSNALRDSLGMLRDHVHSVFEAVRNGAAPNSAAGPVAKYLARVLLEARELAIPIGPDGRRLADLARFLRARAGEEMGAPLGDSGEHATMSRRDYDSIRAAGQETGLVRPDGQVNIAQLLRQTNQIAGRLEQSLAIRRALDSVPAAGERTNLAEDLRDPAHATTWRHAQAAEPTSTPDLPTRATSAPGHQRAPSALPTSAAAWSAGRQETSAPPATQAPATYALGNRAGMHHQPTDEADAGADAATGVARDGAEDLGDLASLVEIAELDRTAGASR